MPIRAWPARHRGRVVAEGLVSFRDQADRRFGSVDPEFVGIRAEMAAGFAAVRHAN